MKNGSFQAGEEPFEGKILRDPERFEDEPNKNAEIWAF
jgi:hypothetical protein